jgi:hypothetical protein
VESGWNWSTKLGIDGGEDRGTKYEVRSTRGAYVAMRMMMESDWNWSTKLGIDGSTKYERRVRSNEDDGGERLELEH